jgi:hypothetical protein
MKHSNAKLGKDGFVAKAELVHKNKFDYSKVEYLNNKTPVIICCPIHGDFSQRPDGHLQGHGCDKCGGTFKLSVEQFIQLSNQKHSSKYNYKKVAYAGNKKNVIITCSIHGDFLQTPNQHLRGSGCPICGRQHGVNLRTMTLTEFVSKANNVHDYKFDYSQVEYINNHTNVSIICPNHGLFEQTPNSHLSGNGCSACSGCKLHTTESFIEKSISVHGDKYDYSKSTYAINEKVVIACPIHGEFYQTPLCHMRGQGCPKCGKVISSSARRITQEEFIARAKEIHCDKYDYSKSKYTVGDELIAIICPIHGDFKQKADNHLAGRGCDKCGGTSQLTSDEFIIRAKQRHGDKFDYSETHYKNAQNKIGISCRSHGKFRILPFDHINSRYGCQQCGVLAHARAATLTFDDFIQKAVQVHGNKYDYSQVDYIDVRSKISISCHTHGKFIQQPCSHVQGQGCPKCSGNSLLTTEEFIQKSKLFHGNKYDYSRVIYSRQTVKVELGCPKHGWFFQQAGSHMRGSGCWTCSESKGERRIRMYLDNRGIAYTSQYRLSYGGRFDFYLPEYNLGIEFNGRQHYMPIAFGSRQYGAEIKNLKDNIRRDNKKFEWALKSKIQVAVIPFWDMNRIINILDHLFDCGELDVTQPPNWLNKYIKSYSVPIISKTTICKKEPFDSATGI